MSDDAHSAEAPVTGQGRMDVAWGANSGDENPDAVQTASTAQSGEIFEQHYTPWTGQLNPRWMRNWSILRHHLLGVFRKGHRPWTMPTRIFILIAFLASLADAGMTLLSGLVGSAEFHALFGVSRDNLYGHVLGFFPRNVLYYPRGGTAGRRCDFRRPTARHLCPLLLPARLQI